MVSPLKYADTVLLRVNEAMKYYGVPKHSCIAGGLVRDTLLGVEVKDIDVFINTDNQDVTQMIGRIYKKYPVRNIVKTGSMVQYAVTNIPIISIVEVAKEPWPIQFIFTKFLMSPLEPTFSYCQKVVSTFDFDICQAYRYGGYSFTSNDFDRAQASNTMTQLCVNRSKQSLIKRIKRLRTKYPSWTLVLNASQDTPREIERESRPDV